MNARLPGQGEQPETCGKPSPHHCNTCGQPFWAYSSCRQRDCPACSQKWGSKEALRASKRLWLKRFELIQAGFRPRILHTCISVRYTGQTLNEARAEARRIARQKGLAGELIIYHPFRQDDDDEWACDGYIHFHIVGIALGDVKPAMKGEGFMWKVIPDKVYGDYRGVRKLSHLKRMIQYLLSHSGIVDHHHGVSWSGCLSYNKFKQTYVDSFPDPPKKGRPCPNCRSTDTEPCDQWDLIPTFTNQSFEDQAKFGLLTVHPYPDSPPPPRQRVVVQWTEVHQ